MFVKRKDKKTENYEYEDITNEVLKNTTPGHFKIKKIFEYKEYNLSNAKFDTKDIINLEIDVARKIQNKTGGVFELIHRVQINGVSTTDAKYYNKQIFNIVKYFDIKSPKKSESLNSKNKKYPDNLTKLKDRLIT